ncbi:MAG: hypothetical protein M1813_005249 [Trichoglossum hirsutum]|nr:MAG: hypothetical protein M1813_005249 [Trichoglossum hirsutum]
MESYPEIQQVSKTPVEPLSLISIDIPLQIDDIRASELSSKQHNSDIQRRIPRQLIIEDLGRTAFKAQILDYRLGTYCSRPACLLIMRFAFTNIPSRQNIRKATIEVVFDDEPFSGEPNSELRPQLRKPRDPGPVYLGREETVENGRGRSFGVNAGVGMPMPSLPISGFSLGLQQIETYSSRTRAKISGECQGDPPWGIVWTLEQNPTTKNGVARDFAAALVVEHTENRRFSGFVKVCAEIETMWGSRTPTWGENDEPVYFDPQVIRNREGPVIIGNKTFDVARDFDEEDIARFTRILFAGEEGHPLTVV